ncbi:hypothetical protein OUZ56_021422 [Daphnia magna]|uniref:Uncharacterized protein n=1 Tax=Daphnia magna TaxID=35525 RepID=A0ABQ9ZHD7_9CRUS|nr:hypothetical protein OUZ56_021422 [Daphnia magna]
MVYQCIHIEYKSKKSWYHSVFKMIQLYPLFSGSALNASPPFSGSALNASPLSTDANAHCLREQ